MTASVYDQKLPPPTVEKGRLWEWDRTQLSSLSCGFRDRYHRICDNYIEKKPPFFKG